MTQQKLAWLTRAKRFQTFVLAVAGWLALPVLPGSAATYTVLNTNDSGTGSFRQALISANTNPGPDTIVFQITGSGVRTISPASALPSIADPVVIDGTTQAGYAGKPLIELNGSSAGNNAGLRLLTGNITVRGLAINRFKVSGIQIEGPGTNVIQGNFIGTDASGTLRRGNASDGILITGSSWNLVGGTNQADHNVISANGNGGIYLLNCSNNVVMGNYIGTTWNGTAALGNTNSGIIVNSSTGNSTSGNVIGGTMTGAGNVLSGNTFSGVILNGANTRNNVVQGNFVGTDYTGTVALGNGTDGVTVSESSGNLIGGTQASGANLISGNRQNGVALQGAGATNNVVQGNLIGVDVSGDSALANSFSGIALTAASRNQIGGTQSTARNVISANRMAGIYFEPGSSNNVVQGNFIGTDLAGTNALGNAANGISIEGASSNLIGGTLSGARNLISGNAYHGIQVFNAGASNNLVQGNFIGTDARGKSTLGNHLYGVHLKAPWNVVGGSLSGAGNLISGNMQHGLVLESSDASGNLVQGNYVGTEAGGTNALGNGLAGMVLIDAPENMVGGAASGAGNLISGNGNNGFSLVGAGTTGNQIQGNTIGADVTGMVGLGNGVYGLSATDAPANTIGGELPGAGNLISGNQAAGVYLSGAAGNVIQGNLIGTKRDGVSGLGNGSPSYPHHAVECQAGANNTLIIGNRIGFAPIAAVGGAGYCGVRIRTGSMNNAILGNAIFSNGGLGIDLGNAGVDPNDPCDTDSGANQLQNSPVLSSAASGPASVLIRGTLNSTANSSFLVQFFADSACDPRGNGEGEVYLGQTTVTTGPDCNASFAATFSATLPAGSVVTATATDGANNTSEFSGCQPVSALAAVQLGNLAATYDGTPKPVSVVTTPANLPVAVTYDGSAAAPVNAGSYAVVVSINDSSYQGGTNGTLVIGQASQSITFAPLADQVYGAGPLTLNATASSGLAVGFELVSGPASLTGNQLVLTGAGMVTVRATQPGNNNYLAATEVTRSFTVGKELAAVTLANLTATFDGTPKPVSVVTSPLNLPVAVTYNGNGTVPINAGSYAVVVTINDTNYQGQTNGTLVIGQAGQSITFTPLADQEYSVTPITLGATASSGLTVSFELASGPANLTGNRLSLTGTGLVTVRATQAGNSNYLAAAEVMRSFTVTKAQATVMLDHLAATYDGTPRPVTVMTSPTNLPITVTYDGSAVAPSNAGSYTVVAMVNDSSYQGQTNGTLVIGRASQTITMAPLADQIFGTGPVTLSAAASSGLPVSLELVSGPASLEGNRLTLTGLGVVTVRATQPGNSNYLAATEVTASFNVTKVPVTFTFGNLAETYDGTPKPVSWTSSPAVLTVAVTYNGSPVAPINAGSYAVVASVDDTYYQGYTNVTMVIAKASQSISFAPLADQLFGAEPLALSATASSDLPVSFELVSGPASLAGNQLSLTGTGLVTVRATQTGNSNYLAAAEITRSFKVGTTPPLTATLTGNGQLTVSWAAIGQQTFVLQETTSLAAPVSWAKVPQTPTLQDGRMTVLVPLGNGNRFYTLTSQ